jgi:predicted ATP-grasp superfamily ATP-dependent carboligase
VLDGHSPGALAFTRSLGRAKDWVAVGSNLGLYSPADSSRFCRLRCKYPVPSEDVSGFVEAILQFARQNAIELIVPVTDWTVLPLSKYREQFQGICRLALGPHAALEIASDKFKTISLARELQIPVPETQLIQAVEDLEGAAANCNFPVVVKDRFSARWEGNRAILGAVAYAYSKDDLRQKVSERLKHAGDVLIQQFVPGQGIGFSSLATEQGVLLPFMWERLRETDPRGSGSSASVSVPIMAEVRASSTALVKRVGLQGISMVEFKKPRNGGAPVLMEINARPWGSIQLPISCGVDYPVLLANWLLTGKLPAAEIAYKTGITCRRLVSELTHLEHTYRGTPAGWPIPYPSFFQTLLKVSVPWYLGMRYSDLWWSDPSPGLAGLARWWSGHFAASKSAGKTTK